MSENDSLMTEVGALVQAENLESLDPQCPINDVELDAVERELGVVLPPSYRAFLIVCGSGRVGGVDVFGLPRNHLWGDIVLMNQLAGAHSPPRFLKFASNWTGRAYYFDTSVKTGDREWPVVVLEPFDTHRQVAGNFLEFLRKLAQGPITIMLERNPKAPVPSSR
jgi:hypothetical protein